MVPESWKSSSTHCEGAQHPVPGQALGNPQLIVDVGVEALHGPDCVLLHLAVQRVLLLHVLGSDSRGTRDTPDSNATAARLSPAAARLDQQMITKYETKA